MDLSVHMPACPSATSQWHCLLTCLHGGLGMTMLPIHTAAMIQDHHLAVCAHLFDLPICHLILGLPQGGLGMFIYRSAASQQHCVVDWAHLLVSPLCSSTVIWRLGHTR